jgi:oligopeptide transport system substrate-binding protein
MIEDFPRSLDPQLTTDIPAQRVLDDLFEGLVTLDIDGRPIPGAATSWQLSADGKTWVFPSARGARWSNGAPVTAEDFLYSWRREVDPKTGAGYAQALAPIVNALDIALGRKPAETLGVEANDAHTLTVHLVAPTPYLLELLDQVYLYPVYRPAIERYGDDWVRPEHIVSNGAFTLHEEIIGNRITLSANPYYWDAARVRLQSVVYYSIPDRAQAVLRYLAGDVQFTDSFAASQRPWLKKTLGEQVVNSPWLGTYMLASISTAAVSRQCGAASSADLSVDRAALTRALKYDMYEPADTLMPPLSGYQPQHPSWAALSQLERNDLARRLYREAGYSRPSIRCASTSAPRCRVPTSGIISRRWPACGTRCWAPKSAWMNRNSRCWCRIASCTCCRCFSTAWIGDFADPVNFLQLFYSGTSLNYGGYCRCALRRLLDAPRRSPTMPRATVCSSRPSSSSTMMPPTYRSTITPRAT